MTRSCSTPSRAPTRPQGGTRMPSAATRVSWRSTVSRLSSRWSTSMESAPPVAGPRPAPRGVLGDQARARPARCRSGSASPVQPLFVLPGIAEGGSGGSHSIVQEVAGLRRLGVAARIAVPEKALERVTAVYPDDLALFAPYRGDRALGDVVGDANVVIATHSDSVRPRRRRPAAAARRSARVLRAGLRALLLARGVGERPPRLRLVHGSRGRRACSPRRTGSATWSRPRMASRCTRSSRASTARSTAPPGQLPRRVGADRDRGDGAAAHPTPAAACDCRVCSSGSPACTETEVEIVTFGCPQAAFDTAHGDAACCATATAAC